MDSEKNRGNSIYRSIMLVLITAMITFMITSIILYNYFTKTEDGQLRAIENYAESSEITKTVTQRFEVVKKYLEKKYIGELNEEAMLQSAIKGYVDGLEDEYTEYLTKSEFQDLMTNISGDFVGIGIYMTKDNDGNVIVIAPIEDSPAEEVGIETGDIINKVNQEECKDMDLDLVSTKIKGEEGTKVKLELLRNGEVIEKEVERRTVVIKDSYSETLKGNIGYIQLITFDESSSDNVKGYIEEFQKNGIDKIILDLRDNTGGMVTEAIELCELFIKKDKIIMKTYNKEKSENIVKSTNSSPKEVKLILLVNGMSASASEIVTGALKDNEAAIVIGTKTFGKGVMQEIVPMFEGGLKLTTEEFFTPNGDKINKNGIEPHIVIEDNPETEEDEQLERAMQELNS